MLASQQKATEAVFTGGSQAAEDVFPSPMEGSIYWAGELAEDRAGNFLKEPSCWPLDSHVSS